MSAATIIAYIIAIGIPIFTVYLFIALDVFGTGKISTILWCMGWGAAGAFGLAYMLNTALLDEGLGYETLTRFVAPILEESLKSLILIYLVQHPRFRYIVDGAVYGIAVGIGFGLSENVLIYIPSAGDAALGAAITRTLSTALMHATASGVIGISLGRWRRATGNSRITTLVLGWALAIGLHMFYNNLVGKLSGMTLLLVAVGIGLGGGVFIAVQINRGLVEEKKRFAETLGLNVGVSTGERKAVQQLGSSSMEEIFGELNQFFGGTNIGEIRKLLVMQANLGILRNNLNSPVSDRLREAWEEEIKELQDEIEDLRKELGKQVSNFLQTVFPMDDPDMQEALNQEMGRFDPTLVHTFDMFMRISELAEKFTPEQLAALADRLHSIEIFKNVSAANLENLCRAISPQSFVDSDILFEQGDVGDAMYLIEEGQVQIFTRDQEGEIQPIRIYEVGAVVGEFALLDGQPRSAGARAIGAVRVMVLQRQVFTMFIQSRPQVVLAMLKYLAEKARFTTQAVENSVSWMTRIAQGNYEHAKPRVAPKQSTAELEPANMSADTTDLIDNIFSDAAAKLQEREQTMRGSAA
jgi:RsiW-degrading membrane proteinase PrsW (M82 family)/CRP-like cAMP-binding protein